jgi:hypothetical protein
MTDLGLQVPGNTVGFTDTALLIAGEYEIESALKEVYFDLIEHFTPPIKNDYVGWFLIGLDVLCHLPLRVLLRDATAASI